MMCYSLIFYVAFLGCLLIRQTRLVQNKKLLFLGANRLCIHVMSTLAVGVNTKRTLVDCCSCNKCTNPVPNLHIAGGMAHPALVPPILAPNSPACFMKKRAMDEYFMGLNGFWAAA